MLSAGPEGADNFIIIYKTTNILNNKIYVGQDSKNNPNYLGSGKYIWNAIKKYGIENFKKETICECNTKEDLNKKEIHWIKTLNCMSPNGYNLTTGGEGGDTFSNNPNKEEIRLKVSNAGKGKNMGDKNPMSNPIFLEKMKKRLNEVSYKWSGENNPSKRPEVIQKIRESKLGKRHPEEWKKERKRRMNEKKYLCLSYFNTFNIFL